MVYQKILNKMNYVVNECTFYLLTMKMLITYCDVQIIHKVLAWWNSVQ